MNLVPLVSVNCFQYMTGFQQQNIIFITYGTCTGGFGGSPVFDRGASGFGASPTFGGAPIFGGSPTFGSPGKIFGSTSPTASSELVAIKYIF
jgi:hypothetical protein